MKKHVLDATIISKLEDNTIFVFQLDAVRPRKEYFFAKCEDRYAQIYESEAHMKKAKNPAFVDCTTVVLEVICC